METATPLFRERQRFSSVLLLWVIAIPSSVIPLLVWLALRKSNPSDNWGLIISIVMTVVTLVVLFTTRLDTELRTDGIYARLYPFRSVFYSWSDVEKVYIRQYNPIGEYGGWGLRYSRNGRALNVSGNIGIQLELKNGKQLLIGTKQPDKAKAAIQAAFGGNSADLAA